MRYQFDLKAWPKPHIVLSDEIDRDSDEAKVLEYIRAFPRKVPKEEIARHLRKMGSHERFEKIKEATTVRLVQQLIRNLRDLHCPIISDRSGSWIATSIDEIETFAEYLENKAKADIASMMTLRRSMLSMVSSKTPSLFDKILTHEQS